MVGVKNEIWPYQLIGTIDKSLLKSAVCDRPRQYEERRQQSRIQKALMPSAVRKLARDVFSDMNDKGRYHALLVRLDSAGATLEQARFPQLETWSVHAGQAEVVTQAHTRNAAPQTRSYPRFPRVNPDI